MNKDFIKSLNNNQDRQEKGKSIKNLHLKRKRDSEILNKLYETYKREASRLIYSEGVCYMNAVLKCF